MLGKIVSDKVSRGQECTDGANIAKSSNMYSTTIIGLCNVFSPMNSVLFKDNGFDFKDIDPQSKVSKQNVCCWAKVNAV